MGPNIFALRAYLARLTNPTSLKETCDACDAVTPGSTRTYAPHRLVTFVTPARVFAVMQVARPASVDVKRWQQAVNDAGVFLDTWGGTAERLGWNAREIMGPQLTPAALAWALEGSHVVSLTQKRACLSDGRSFKRALKEVAHEAP